MNLSVGLGCLFHLVLNDCWYTVSRTVSPNVRERALGGISVSDTFGAYHEYIVVEVVLRLCIIFCLYGLKEATNDEVVQQLLSVDMNRLTCLLSSSVIITWRVLV